MLQLTRFTQGVAMFVLLLTAASQAVGQTTAPSDDPPAATRPSTTATTAPSKFTLNFKDVPLDAVLDYFSQTIGFEILRDGPVDARVSIMSKQPVTPEEAVTMLSAALKANGFTAVREGRLLRIGSRDKLKKTNIPVHFGNKPEDVPETDELITQVIPIDNVSAVKLRDDLKALMPPDADVTANEGSNTIIITDTASNIHRIVLIISQLDAHEATTADLRMFQLHHASAASTAKLIEDLFKTPAPMQQGQQQMRGQPQGNQGPPPPAAGSERHGQSIVVAADERTNTVLVLASTATLNLIDGIIKRLDSGDPNPGPRTTMRLFHLNYAAADATAKLINDTFKAAGGGDNALLRLIYGDVGGGGDEDKSAHVNAQSDDRTNTVIVTATPEKLLDVEALIHQLDTSPMVSQEIRPIRLKHADAFNVAKLLTDIFLPKKDEQQGNQRFGIILLSLAQQEQQPRSLQINISADERTNTLVISAPTAVLDEMEKVVRQLDSDPATEDTLFIYHLRNSQATHMAATLNLLFGNTAGAGSGQNNQQFAQGQQYNNPLQQNQNQGGNRGGNNPPNNNNNNNNGQNGNNRNNNNRNGQAPVSAAVNKLANELTGQAFVVPEPDSNALLVTTGSKFKTQVQAIIEDLDQPAQQVLIRVLLAEVTLDNGEQLGVDFSVLNLRQSVNGSNSNTTTTTTGTVTTSGTPGLSLPTNTTAGTVVNSGTTEINQGSVGIASLGAAAAATASPSGLVYSLLERNVSATLQALQTEGKLDVLSRPYILTSDNQEASIFVGEQDPFVTDTRVETTGQLVNTIDYKQIGVNLDVTPHINPDGVVVMDVNPTVSQRQPGGVTITQGVVSPIYSSRTASAHVAIPDGSTIVIGGMMQDSINEQINKIPLLGDLPLVGPLFQNKSSQKVKTELLFFLTPRVAPLPAKLAAMSRDVQKGLTLTPHAVGPGVFDSHMREMNRGEPATQPAVLPSPIKTIPLNDPDDAPPQP